MSAQPGYYSRPGLAYYLAGEVPVGALYPYNEGYYRKLNLHFMKETVARINPAEHVLNMAGGRIVPYNRLLVATGATEILGKKNKVVGVRTDDGQVTPCQIVGVAIGIRPHKELAQNSGLAVRRGVLVNDRQMTSDPDVFSAGDVAQVIDADHPEGLLESLWNPAQLQGTVAGLNMAGIATARRLLAIWHAIHIPLGLTLFAMAFVHVIGAVYYASKNK